MLLGTIALAAFPSLQEADSAPAVLDHAALTAQLQAIAAAHPDVARVVSIGKSRGGRSLDVLTLGAPSDDVGAAGRPAILVVGNLEGPYAYTSTLVVEAARRLAADKGTLDATTFHFLPRANPDGAEARFGAPLSERWATGHGVDDDRDGRAGEDGPSDVDGDGVIAWMRVPDPDGEWIEDPTDGRALIEADRSKGQKGRWKLVAEGRDSDDDEEASEDPALDTHVHRNFAQDWKEHDPAYGLFPTDEPEVLAINDFVLAHPALQLVVVYGEQGNLVGELKSVDDAAPAKMRVPPSGVRKSDAALLKEFGERYKDATENEVEGSRENAGTLQSWSYSHRGLLTLSIAPWEIPLKEKKQEGEPAPEDKDADPEAQDPEQAADGTERVAVDEDGEAPEEVIEEIEEVPADEDEDEDEEDDEKPSDDAKRLQWIDREGEAARFLPWTPFEHPELGTVEIGGFAPYAQIEPPAGALAEISEREAAFVSTLGDLLARVQVTDASAKSLGGGLVEVEAALVNDALLPLRTVWGARTRTTRPVKLELVLEDAELLAGRTVELVNDLPGSGGRHEARWLVRLGSNGRIVVRAETDHAGRVELPLEVQ